MQEEFKNLNKKHIWINKIKEEESNYTNRITI